MAVAAVPPRFQKCVDRPGQFLHNLLGALLSLGKPLQTGRQLAALPALVSGFPYSIKDRPVQSGVNPRDHLLVLCEVHLMLHLHFQDELYGFLDVHDISILPQHIHSILFPPPLQHDRHSETYQCQN